MPHTLKGQRVGQYRRMWRPSLSAIRQSPRVSSTRRSPLKGWNYNNRNNYLGIITGYGPNVPPWGAPTNRAALQKVINNARAAYRKAKTPVSKNAVLNQFARNHAAALNALRRIHIAQLENLKKEINALRQTSSNRLSRSLNSQVSKLLANLRKSPKRQRR